VLGACLDDVFDEELGGAVEDAEGIAEGVRLEGRVGGPAASARSAGQTDGRKTKGGL
jgi:hypothetical protein